MNNRHLPRLVLIALVIFTIIVTWLVAGTAPPTTSTTSTPTTPPTLTSLPTLPPTSTSTPPTSEPPASTTTAAPTSTSTTPTSTTSTTAPPTSTTIPPTAAWCLVDQILREPTWPSRGGVKDAFTIILTNLGIGEVYWRAPYVVDLATIGYPQGYGWVSGDRSGYYGSYMFLVEGISHPPSARIVARVTFAVAGSEAAAYSGVNDSGQFSIQTTHLTFEGGCDEDARQDQQPRPMTTIVYTENNDPDSRPLVPIYNGAGVLVEDRSYTNTVAHPRLKFREVERITEPFTQRDGVGGTHTVYQRVTVVADFDTEGDEAGYLPVIVVYYDLMVPDFSFGP